MDDAGSAGRRNRRRSRARSTLMGAVAGAIPGVVLVLLTGPVSGEAELTLGVGGIFLALVGLVIGAGLGARRRPSASA